jgi:heme/copper-type cytochrome/quinol oxidase subunit 1
MAVVTAPPAPPPIRPRPGRTALVVLVSLVVLGVGLLAVAAWVATRPTAYGWFAYAPMSNTTFSPSMAYPPFTAALLAGAGALLVGGAVGFAVGRAGRPGAAVADGDGTDRGDVPRSDA